MDNTLNYYHILGVSYYATFKEIKEAYRKKVKEYHPDKKSGNAELFKSVKEAYEVLQNSEKRKQYDEMLFQTANQVMQKTRQAAPSKSHANSTVVNIGRKKRVSFTALTINAAFILIGVLGKAYLNRNK